jgi:hypothetical protein
MPRNREWDAVVSARCSPVGDECEFVALERGRRVHIRGTVDVSECAARALERELEPPYRAIAVRRDGDTWAVGAVAIEVADVPADVQGEELMLTVTEEGEPELLVDGRPNLTAIEALTRVAGDRHTAYVLRAERLQGSLWEVTVDPL